MRRALPIALLTACAGSGATHVPEPTGEAEFRAKRTVQLGRESRLAFETIAQPPSASATRPDAIASDARIGHPGRRARGSSTGGSTTGAAGVASRGDRSASETTCAEEGRATGRG